MKKEVGYEEKYLRERVRSLQLELSLLDVRAKTILEEMPTIEKQLKKYENKEKDKS